MLATKIETCIIFEHFPYDKTMIIYNAKRALSTKPK